MRELASPENTPKVPTGKQSHYDTLHSMSVDPVGATPMVSQFLTVKSEYPGIILFYRMGDFYETFFEDALITARVLEITLTGRDAGKAGRIPMAGIPVKAAETYLTKLLSQNLKVAICEQMEDPSQAKGLVKRQVVRVLSSGTITEQSLLRPEENNFLAAIHIQSQQACGLAYCDVTTGEFRVTELSFLELLSELDRIRPVEILVKGRKRKATSIHELDSFIADVPPEISENYRCTPLPEGAFQVSDTRRGLLDLFQVASLEGFGLEDQPCALQAAGTIGYYISRNFLDQLPVFNGIRLYSLQQTVTMNTTARRNLELLSTAKSGQTEGSLLWVLNQTCTSMGARLLRQWINQPLTHLPEIESRLDGVEELVRHADIRESVRHLLPDIYDIERLSTKVANFSASPRDLIALKHSIARLPDLSNLLKPLESFYLNRLQDFPPELFKMMALIEQAIDDSPSLNLKEGGIIKTGYHAQLDQMRELVRNHETWLAQYEQEQRERTGIKTLKVSFNSAFGYFIEVTRANSGAVPADYHRKQTLTNAERYTTDILKTHEAQVLDAQSNQYELEYTLFMDLRQKLLTYAHIVADSAQRVAVLDVLQSLATVAVEQNYVRPHVDDSLEINLQQSRHPVVEKILPLGRFVPNNVALSADPEALQIPQMMIITGPNMAGKSTYMRQVAQIILMAQMGSFVPASYARIGLVDGIYTRVGAVDDLSSGQSTFMVEMNETAQILHGATRRSLVLLDEVGRGTSTYDGVSIAWAVSEYMTQRMGCRTLFATHYHELNTLEQNYPKIANYRVCVAEADGEIEFLHTVEPGAAQKSYGIQVAKMAGLPAEIIHKAEAILSQMQRKELAAVSAKASREETLETPQLSLF
ncbi:DNA mismatch repair protein MutS [Vampirovibrio chlorellavorus]|uniref:DNA mismatch repair protein MutS n=1 Tax=Vampirovibrio chlorellavorus TaxID=758823 RepID=UPI0026F2F420|nr:DNA mismatch repair protein MutS [Vampirovibrio chlorellavorus]